MGSVTKGEHVMGDYRLALAYKSRFIGVTFEDCKMECSDFTGAEFLNCFFIRCDLSKCCLIGATFQDVDFRDCNLDLAELKGAIIRNASFVGGRMEYASFENATLTNVRFDTQMHGADLRYASAEKVNYGDSNLWGAAFTVSCNAFLGKKLSERSLCLFLALLCETEGNDEIRANVLTCLPEQYVPMLKKLTVA